MKLTHIWIVTKPTANSTLADICFQTDLAHGLAAQYRGGLDPDSIHGFWDNQDSAFTEAARLLRKRDRQAKKG